jgi:adenylate cyclase
MRAVWPDTYAREEVLRYSISELRKAFNDDARNPRMIQTISRRGYRLIAEVSNQCAPPTRTSVAVLAFSDMSSAKDQEYLCDGIVEEIISNLSRIPGLKVASRTSSFAFKSKAEDVRIIGKRLGVAAVLEGSVRKAGDQIRITAQLIRTDDGCHCWSEHYDRELKDVFALQDEIAVSIAAALRIALTPGEADAAGNAPVTDFKACDYCSRGRAETECLLPETSNLT